MVEGCLLVFGIRLICQHSVGPPDIKEVESEIQVSQEDKACHEANLCVLRGIADIQVMPCNEAEIQGLLKQSLANTHS